MGRNKTHYQPAQRHLLKELMPLISVVACFVGIVVWVFSTFATQAQLRDNVDQLKSMVRENHDSTIQHSDMNKEQTLIAIDGIKEAVRSIDSRLKDK